MLRVGWDKNSWQRRRQCVVNAFAALGRLMNTECMFRTHANRAAARQWYSKCAKEADPLPVAQVVWVDFTKFGTLQGGELNDTIDAVRKVISKAPAHSVALIICPVLLSGRLLHGIRSEIRRPHILRAVPNVSVCLYLSQCFCRDSWAALPNEGSLARSVRHLQRLAG